MDDKAFLGAIAAMVLITAFAFGLRPQSWRGIAIGLAIAGAWVLGFGALDLATRGLNTFGTSLFFLGAAALGGVGGGIGLGTQSLILATGGRRALAIRGSGVVLLVGAFFLLLALGRA